MPPGLAFGSGRPRRRPFPFDMVVSGVTGITGNTGLMLGRATKDAPTMIAKKPPITENVQPSEFSYSAQNPMVEQTFVWDDWSLGFGLQNQQSLHDRRYYSAVAADASVRGLVIPGPKITALTPATTDATNGVSHFFEIGGVLYASAGRYCLVRTQIQTITETGSPVTGTFTITFGGNTTGSLNFDVSAADMQTALRLLAGLGSVTVTRTGSMTNFVWQVVMTGVATTNGDPATMTTTSTPIGTPAITVTTVDIAACWTISKDFGAGKVALDVVVTKQNGGSTTLAYVAMGDSELMYKFDGTTWTQHGTMFARAFCLAARELYRAVSTNLVSKVDTNGDPWVEANWGATNQFRAGDNTSAINRMCLNSAGTLLILKTDGIYVLDEDGNDIKLFTGLGIVPDSNNGKAFCNYENWTYVTYNDQFFRISAGLDIEHIGPERAVENASVNKGYVSACVGTAFALYCGLVNRDVEGPTLFKFGAWVPNEDDGQYRKIDAWHGSIIDNLSSGAIQVLYRSTIGAPAGHEQLYFGRANGTISRFQLPCTPNPLNCTSYLFDRGTSFQLTMPYWHGGYPSDTKHIHSATVSGESITTTNYPQLYVREKNSGGAAVNYTSNVLRKDLATDKVIIRGDIGLTAVQDNVAVAPLTITSFSLAFAVRPPVVLTWEFPVLCENGLYRRDGTPLRIGADRIRTVVAAMADTRGSCTVIAPEETSAELAVIDYSEGYAWDDDAQQWRAALYVRATETTKGTEILVA